MYNDRIEFLKRQIRRTYKWYTRDRTDGTATLSDVLAFFNLEFLAEKPDDVEIVFLDSKVPKIRLVDKKTRYIYDSEYSSHDKLINVDRRELSFITTKIAYSPSATRYLTSWIGEKSIAAERLILKENDYELWFDLTKPNDESKKLEMCLLDHYYGDVGNRYERPMYTKVARKTDSYSSSQSYIGDGTSYEKCTISRIGNVIYSVPNNVLEQRSTKMIRGFAIQYKNDIGIGPLFEKFLPYDFEYMSDELKDQTYTGIMHFRGLDNNNRCMITIHKENDKYRISFKKSTRDKEKHETISLIDDTFTQEHNTLTLLGEITAQDVENIIGILREKYPDEEFIDMTTNELLEFENKIKESEGQKEKEVSLTDPEVYLNLPSDKVAQICLDNNDLLFKEMLAEMESREPKAKAEGNVLKKVE